MINIEKYPKCKVLLKGHIKSILKQIQDKFKTEEATELPEISDELVESMMADVITSSPRFLFDFFDENKVFINILHEGGYFKYSIYKHEVDDLSYSFRAEAEIDAFQKAFDTLENEGYVLGVDPHATDTDPKGSTTITKK